MGQSTRVIVVPHAAQALTAALKKANIDCVFVEEMASFIHTGSRCPTSIAAVIVPPIAGVLDEQSVIKYLTELDPVHFRTRSSSRKHPNCLAYYDSSIPFPKKDYCDIVLVPSPNPVPSRYSAKYVVQSGAFAAISPIYAILELLQQASYGSKKLSARKLETEIQSLLAVAQGPDSGFPEIPSPEDISSFFSNIKPLLSSWTFMNLRNLFPQVQCGEDPEDTGAPSSPILPLVAIPTTSLQTPSPLETSPLNPHAPPFTVNINARRAALDRPPSSTNVPSAELSDTKTGSLCKGKVICLIAKKVVDILEREEVGCALFGSLACYLYGNSRCPNDVDMLVLPAPRMHRTADSEWYKERIALNAPRHFSLLPAKDPKATYKVLYFELDSTISSRGSFHKNRCKIDILLPGLMHLPYLSPSQIKLQGGLPVVPFSVLLLQKIQGWSDHRAMTEHYKFLKHTTDAEDIHNLLKLEHVVPLRFSRPWKDASLFSLEFMILTRQRICVFLSFHPQCEPDFKLLGFAP